MATKTSCNKRNEGFGSGLSYSIPTGSLFAAQGLKLALASVEFLIAHVALKRVGMVLVLESEFKKDDRLPTNKRLSNPIECAKYLYETDKGVNGLLRGITPHALFFATAAGIHYLFFKCGIAQLVMPESSDIHFPCLHGTHLHNIDKNSGCMQRNNSGEIVSAALSVTRAVIQTSTVIARVIFAPLLTAALCWPAEAFLNVIQCNYTADIVSHTSNEVTAQPDESQSHDSYLYSNVVDAVTTVWNRVGWHGVLCRSGFEAFALKRYVFYTVFVLPGILASIFNLPNQKNKIVQLQTVVDIFTHPSLINALRELIYFVLTYPLTNIIYRMSLLGADETDGRRKGTSRYQNALECAQSVMAREGWKGLYTGFTYHLIVYALLETTRQILFSAKEEVEIGIKSTSQGAI